MIEPTQPAASQDSVNKVNNLKQMFEKKPTPLPEKRAPPVIPKQEESTEQNNFKQSLAALLNRGKPQTKSKAEEIKEEKSKVKQSIFEDDDDEEFKAQMG